MKYSRSLLRLVFIFILGLGVGSCKEKKMDNNPIHTNKSAAEFLGNPEYRAISYGGYRTLTREDQPSLSQIKEDLKILSAIGIKVVRTYNLQLDQAQNILKAIRDLKSEDAGFEMYVMLGAWIDCQGAWTQSQPNHDIEDLENNTSEIAKAIALANQYPEIVKIIAVGNEAMVHWATSYFVKPAVILKWVSYLQTQKAKGNLPESLWITSSDNFASWGGGGSEYHNEDLKKLIAAVDYISLHTYPFHDTHYNSGFWVESQKNTAHLDTKARIELAVQSAVEYAVSQYQAVESYVESLGIEKPIHIGETGWASVSSDLYGPSGTQATDQYKQALYYQKNV